MSQMTIKTKTKARMWTFQTTLRATTSIRTEFHSFLLRYERWCNLLTWCKIEIMYIWHTLVNYITKQYVKTDACFRILQPSSSSISNCWILQQLKLKPVFDFGKSKNQDHGIHHLHSNYNDIYSWIWIIAVVEFKRKLQVGAPFNLIFKVTLTTTQPYAIISSNLKA